MKKKNFRTEQGRCSEVEYVEDFHHTPASEAVYNIPFPSDEDIPEELLEYEETFLELEQLPSTRNRAYRHSSTRSFRGR